ncbi:MAG: hypothetical protein R6W76_02095 [Caldilinea sp.]
MFVTYFGDLAVQETRVAHLRGYPGLPDGEYGFMELYCDDPQCDCQRVLINVVSNTVRPPVLAVINYGWRTPAFYARWSTSPELGDKMSGAALDPLNAQSQYAEPLLRLFEQIVKDPAYVQRLQRHYAMFKTKLLEQQSAPKQTRQQSPNRKPKAKAARKRKSK